MKAPTPLGASPLSSAPNSGILVAGGTPAMLQVLTSILTEAGYHVQTATDGSLALESAQARPPELILLHIRLPGLDGLEVCRRLKADETTRSIPVILTARLDELYDKARGFEAGAADYLTEPFDSREVLARVATHLELRRTQQALQQAEARFMAEATLRRQTEAMQREILDTGFDAAYRRALTGQTYDYISPAFFQISGYTRAEALTLPVEVILGWIHPEDMPAVREVTAACVAHPGEVGQVEYRLWHKDGTYHWLQDRFTVIADADGRPQSLVGNIRDVTARKQAEADLRDLNEQLEAHITQRTAQLEERNRELGMEIAARLRSEEAVRASEAKYYALFSEMMNGCALHELVCDAGGRPVDYVTLEVNKTYEILLGIQGEEVVGRKASDILPPAELQKWLGIFGPVALTGQSTRYTMYSPLNQRHFEGTAYCPEKGKFAVTFIDVTDRNRAEAELRGSEARYRELAEENARLLTQSRQDAETKAILLHEVNHRVKNNLAAIVGLLQVELHYLEKDEQMPYRSLVEELTGRIQSLALVHNLLSASLWAPLPLTKLAENVMQVAPAMLSHEQPVEMDIAPSAVRLTPKQASAVGLILNELATNSLKHAVRKNRPIAISVQAAQVGDEVRVEYRDNGPGYPDEVLQGRRQSVGLYLIGALAEHDLEGGIALSNDFGAVAQLRFALAPGIQAPNPSAAAPQAAQPMEVP